MKGTLHLLPPILKANLIKEVVMPIRVDIHITNEVVIIGKNKMQMDLTSPKITIIANPDIHIEATTKDIILLTVTSAMNRDTIPRIVPQSKMLLHITRTRAK